MTTTHISEQDVSSITNGVTILVSVREQMNHVLDAALLSAVDQAILEISNGIASARASVEADRVLKQAMYEQYRTTNQYVTAWGVYAVSAFEDDHPFVNASAVVYNDVEIPLLGKSWGDLWTTSEAVVLRGSSEDTSSATIDGFKRINVEGKILLETIVSLS